MVRPTRAVDGDGLGTGVSGAPVRTMSAPTSRSPADILRLVVAVVVLGVLLLVQWLFGDTLIAFTSELLAGFSALPHWIVDAVAIGTRVLAFGVLAVGLVVTLARSEGRATLTTLLGIALAAVLVVLLGQLSLAPDGAQVVAVSVDAGPLSAARSPTAVGIGTVAAALTAAAPWLGRRWRRAGWIAVWGLALTRFIASPLSFDSFQAAIAGWSAGAAALVTLGAPSRRPTIEAITRGLRVVGLPLADLAAAGVDARGSTPYFGTGPAG